MRHQPFRYDGNTFHQIRRGAPDRYTDTSKRVIETTLAKATFDKDKRGIRQQALRCDDIPSNH